MFKNKQLQVLIRGVDNFFKVGGLVTLMSLGGLGACPPRKFLTFSCPEIASGAISLVES